MNKRNFVPEDQLHALVDHITDYEVKFTKQVEDLASKWKGRNLRKSESAIEEAWKKELDNYEVRGYLDSVSSLIRGHLLDSCSGMVSGKMEVLNPDYEPEALIYTGTPFSILVKTPENSILSKNYELPKGEKFVGISESLFTHSLMTERGDIRATLALPYIIDSLERKEIQILPYLALTYLTNTPGIVQVELKEELF